ncbi:toxin-antitoxin system YwqK family antitoxin [Corallococcus sp. AB018]|uniref:toxin-antitoxin system YwqK family antitoxin n=1 Tax=Corallococcus sp. AB018 TaxID=2316715 RepID=UPI000F87F2E4|nr:toxin-antitoxin system YwqK family antitoxin [Corallococcus sp. AB018]RUO91787.1 toxin-antitoxin system YwqK family antitoxin [Corallococcus sp. AB018]
MSPPNDKTATVTERDEQGRKRKQYTLDADGKPHGVLMLYEEGTLAQQFTFRHGVLHGEALVHEQGQPRLIQTFARGVLHGPFTAFHAGTGQPSLKAHYRDGKLDGDHESFSPRGALLRKASYVKGQLTDEVVEFQDNGQLRTRTAYVDGKPHGEALEFHPDGKLAKRTVFEHGVPVEGPVEFAPEDSRSWLIKAAAWLNNPKGKPT